MEVSITASCAAACWSAAEASLLAGWVQAPRRRHGAATYPATLHSEPTATSPWQRPDGSFSARKDTLCRGGFAQSSGFAQSFRSPGRTRGWIPGVVPHSHRSKCRRRSARNDDPKWSSAGAQNITLGRCAFALCVHPFPCSWPIMFLICARGAKHLPLAKILCHHEGRRSCDRRRRRPGCCPGSQLPGSRSRRFAGAAGAVRSFGGWKVHHGVVRL